MTGWKMRPTTSALGVIAIVSAMITATASETGSGAIEQSINHLGDGGEEERYLPEDGRPMNESSRVERGRSVFFHRNDTGTEMTAPRDPVYPPTTEPDSRNVSNVGGDVTDGQPAELQRDQGDVRGAVRPSNDPWNDTSHGNDPAGSENRIGQQEASGNREEAGTTRDHWLVTSGSSRPENTTSRSLLESRMVPESKMIELDRSKDPGAESSDQGRSAVPGAESEGSSGSTAYAIQETIGIATEIGPIERKNVEDIRAISFQVPAPELADGDGTERQVHRSDGKPADETRKFSETRKEHSRPLNNLLLAGKSTKAFYEIKPSIKTEMENGQEHQPFPSTQRSLTARKFILPSVDSAFGKFGPYFEDGDKEINITARIGSTVLLDCKIGMLGDKEVTWAQHSKDSFRLLTVGRTPYSADQRISPNFRYPNNWRLQIQYASPRDSGLYKCQVATHPPLVKKINVIVTAPELTITDDSGRIVPKERHLKAGSALRLRCEARDVLESLEESVVWTRGDETLTEDVSENRTTEISAGKEVLVIVSTLIVERASPRHAGNYSCLVPGKAKTTIAVHVLNGELPAAVHDGNGVSRSFLNLWLIHLTMSYVFSR